MWQQPDTRKLVLWGGTCIALPPQGFHPQYGTCLVGSEGGAVFRCNLDGSCTALQAFTQVLPCFVKKFKALGACSIQAAVDRDTSLLGSFQVLDWHPSGSYIEPAPACGVYVQRTTTNHCPAQIAHHGVAQHSTAQHSTAQHSTAQHSIA